jgi:hypothetical protein
LSRFPLNSSADTSGTRFDQGKVAAIIRRIHVSKDERSNPIDSYAPRFSSLFHKGLPYVDQHTYMNQYLTDPTHDELDPAGADQR